MTPAAFKSARYKLGLTEAQLARALQVDQRTVRRWGAGPNDVPGPVAVVMGIWLDPRCPKRFRPQDAGKAG